MNRRGNLRRGESTGRPDEEISVEGETTGGNLLEKHGHGKAKRGAQSGVRHSNQSFTYGALKGAESPIRAGMGQHRNI